jgi:hypothetical protein
MEFKDSKGNIARVFYTEWNRELETWPDFIKRKDIGIEFLTNNIQGHFYEIVDEKKWMLTKIKYEI